MKSLPLIRPPDTPPEFDNGYLIHTCCVCGCRGVWGPEWSWYGNWIDYLGRDQDVVCSAQCREKHSKQLKVSSKVIEERW